MGQARADDAPASAVKRVIDIHTQPSPNKSHGLGAEAEQSRADDKPVNNIHNKKDVEFCMKTNKKGGGEEAAAAGGGGGKRGVCNRQQPAAPRPGEETIRMNAVMSRKERSRARRGGKKGKGKRPPLPPPPPTQRKGGETERPDPGPKPEPMPKRANKRPPMNAKLIYQPNKWPVVAPRRRTYNRQRAALLHG